MKLTRSLVLIALLAIVACLPISLHLQATAAADAGLVGTVKLTSGTLNVRSEPSTKAEIIGSLTNGKQVTVLKQLDQWAEIAYNGSSAYVSTTYLTIAKGTVKAEKPKGKIIVLDPGHGGKDPGAIAADGTFERTLNWSFAVKAKELLEQAGYTVYLTRNEKSSCIDYKTSEEDLKCRVDVAKKLKGDILISLHINSHEKSTHRGTVTYYNARDDWDGNQNPFPKESKALAQAIHAPIQKAIGSKDRGVDNKNFYMNRMSAMPSALIELAFMSNPDDLKLLKGKNMPETIGNALVTGVNKYFGY